MVNDVTLQIMSQWSWLAWALISAIASLTKVAEITKSINLTQLALFVAKMATFLDNAGKTRVDHPLLMLAITYKI